MSYYCSRIKRLVYHSQSQSYFLSTHYSWSAENPSGFQKLTIFGVRHERFKHTHRFKIPVGSKYTHTFKIPKGSKYPKVQVYTQRFKIPVGSKYTHTFKIPVGSKYPKVQVYTQRFKIPIGSRYTYTFKIPKGSKYTQRFKFIPYNERVLYLL